jgi:lipopolysaccharide transport protein LptA
LTASGAPGAGLQEATFSGNVDYRETQAARGKLAAVNRTARATRLAVKTSPGLGAIQQADFRGNVHITDGPQIVADAPRVLYRVTDDRMDLSPGEGETGKDPQVTDGRVTIVARTIELTPSTRRMKAETDVRSTIASKTRSGTQGGKMPSMLQDDRPVNVTANRLDYNGEAGLATYSGDTRLWQDKGTSIKAPTLIVDDNKGNLTGEGGVLTLMSVSETDPKTKVRKETLTTGTAETFVYDDAKRMATYTTKARLWGAQGDLTAEKIELHLAAKTNDLERLEGFGAVTVKEANRTATGTRLTYTAEDDLYVMTGDIGTPVVVIERKPNNDCTRTQGTRLEFRRAIEGIEMNAMESIPCTAESFH